MKDRIVNSFSIAKLFLEEENIAQGRTPPVADSNRKEMPLKFFKKSLNTL
jgi:hypothetical protein